MSQMSKRHYVKGGFHSGILICKQYLTFGVALFDSILSCPSYLIFLNRLIYSYKVQALTVLQMDHETLLAISRLS